MQLTPSSYYTQISTWVQQHEKGLYKLSLAIAALFVLVGLELAYVNFDKALEAVNGKRVLDIAHSTEVYDVSKYLVTAGCAMTVALLVYKLSVMKKEPADKYDYTTRFFLCIGATALLLASFASLAGHTASLEKLAGGTPQTSPADLMAFAQITAITGLISSLLALLPVSIRAWKKDTALLARRQDVLPTD